MVSKMAMRIQADMVEPSAAICPALYGMKRTPLGSSLTHCRIENFRASCRAICASAPTAELVTERIESNMRLLVFFQEGAEPACLPPAHAPPGYPRTPTVGTALPCRSRLPRAPVGSPR